MTKWVNQDWLKGVRFGMQLKKWSRDVNIFLAGMALGLLFMLWLVYA